MRNFQATFETRKRSFISAFSICMTVPLSEADSVNALNINAGKCHKIKTVGTSKYSFEY